MMALIYEVVKFPGEKELGRPRPSDVSTSEESRRPNISREFGLVDHLRHSFSRPSHQKSNLKDTSRNGVDATVRNGLRRLGDVVVLISFLALGVDNNDLCSSDTQGLLTLPNCYVFLIY
ncbi:hypothetical protein niasHT_012422 [Heterodera trifolii]|uniref:Uncharacterized protein n=1 Tax=Heterodera trifolii TaxID=157864 RepID=A0ABD2LBM8_9BILA